MRRIWAVAVGLIAAHSLLLGVLMLAVPLSVLNAIGWDYQGSRFFPAQSGLFLVVLGVVYARAVRRRSLGWIIVLSKAMAVLFLLGETVAGNAPKIVYATAIGDGLMGLTVLVLLNSRTSADTGRPGGKAAE